jgi:2-polyprenyl-3-methyl-5-hydroxy-6-metoxy-1,4-benzoquinol methylase
LDSVFGWLFHTQNAYDVPSRSSMPQEAAQGERMPGKKVSIECSIPCDLCGETDAEVLSLKDRDGRYLRTVVCRGCGLVYSDPRPQPEEVRDYYERTYRLDYKGTYQPKPKHVYRAGKAAVARIRRLSDILSPGCNVLDVGAGAGEFVYVLRAMGYSASGLEPNEGYARFASDVLGLPVCQAFYQEAQIAPESQDVITMFHVLEHFDNPSGALGHVRRWLRSDGRLVAEVPNVEAVCQWPHSRFHRAHLYNFSPATLETMGRKAGYTVVRRSVPSDGSNLTVIFGKATPPPAVSGQIAGYFDRIRSIVRGHTVGRHLFRPFLYVRPAQKLAARVEEWCATYGHYSPKETLDKLVTRELRHDK